MKKNAERDRPRSTQRSIRQGLEHSLKSTRARMYAVLLLGGVATATVAWGSFSSQSAPEGDDSLVVEAHPEELVSVQLPVEVNERVEKWMKRFLTDQRPMFEHYLASEGRYGPMIRQKLRERGMPEELIYLAMIESGFSPRATSRVAASGMWQFMSPTARAYGLRVGPYVDERRDPVRATDAALDYLEKLHDRFDSWYLAAAAYNAGPSRVARILRQHGDRGTDGELYWQIIDKLPLETREYVPKILAATLLARDAERYGLEIEAGTTPFSFHRVFVPGGTSLTTVADALGMPVAEIRDMNPHFVRGVTPPGLSYPVRVPVGSSARVVSSFGERLALADD